MDKTIDEQNKLAQKIKEVKRNTKPRNPNIMKEKSDLGREIIFESKIFPLPAHFLSQKNQSH